MTKVPRIIKVPEGEAWVSTENPLGEMGYYVVSKGDLGPFRVKIRSASFNNISIVPWVLKGVYVPDVITILASLYFILGDIDPMIQLRGRDPLLGAVLLRVLGGLVAVLLPAGDDRLPLPVQDDVVHAEPARPDGSRAVRLAAARRRGRQVDAERRPRPRPRPTARSSRWPRSIVLLSTFLLVVGRAVRPRRVLHQLRDRRLLRPRRRRRSACSASSIAGWASANKYSLLGGLRAAGQLIAYELPMVLATLGVVIQAGTMNLQGIVVAQNTGRSSGSTGSATRSSSPSSSGS